MLSLWELEITCNTLFCVVRKQIRTTKWDLYRQIQCKGVKIYIVFYIVPFKQISRLFYVLHTEVTAAGLEL